VLEPVRARLWATSYGERDPETASTSVPVFGLLGELKGALTVSGPLSRLVQKPAMQATLAALLPVAQRVTDEFGANPARYVAAQDALRVRDVGVGD